MRQEKYYIEETHQRERQEKYRWAVAADRRLLEPEKDLVSGFKAKISSE